MEGGAWWATVHGVAKSQTRLSDFTYYISTIVWGKQAADPANTRGEAGPQG